MAVAGPHRPAGDGGRGHARQLPQPAVPSQAAAALGARTAAEHMCDCDVVRLARTGDAAVFRLLAGRHWVAAMFAGSGAVPLRGPGFRDGEHTSATSVRRT